MNLLFHTLLFCFFYLTCFFPNFIRLKIKCAAGYNFAFRYFRTSYLPRIIPRFTDAPLILAKDLSMAGNVQEVSAPSATSCENCPVWQQSRPSILMDTNDEFPDNKRYSLL
ncbi:hypothetical protein ACVOCR_13460, partial [Shigella flexneri]